MVMIDADDAKYHFEAEPSMHQWVAPAGVDQQEWTREVRAHLAAHRTAGNAPVAESRALAWEDVTS